MHFFSGLLLLEGDDGGAFLQHQLLAVKAFQVGRRSIDGHGFVVQAPGTRENQRRVTHRTGIGIHKRIVGLELVRVVHFAGVVVGVPGVHAVFGFGGLLVGTGYVLFGQFIVLLATEKAKDKGGAQNLLL